jgi:hypothetical protein
LSLEHTKISDDGLAFLKGMSALQTLSLYGTRITDRGLEHLKGLDNLKEVILAETKVTEQGARELRKALPRPKINLFLIRPTGPGLPEDG